jgi:hypothetical protein
MLTQKDKREIRKIFQEELKTALLRTITIERGPKKQGDPEKVIKEEEWHVLDFLAAYLPKIEAALRGSQEDIDHAKNQVAEYNNKLEAVGQALLGMEGSARVMAQLADRARKLGLLRHPDLKLIEGEKKREGSS